MHDHPHENPQVPALRIYDGMTKEERSDEFYRFYSFEKKSAGRRETREYIDSLQRMLSSPSGSEPLRRETLKRAFVGESGRDRREAREAARQEARVRRHVAKKIADEGGI